MASIVVPAKDEEDLVGRCLHALAAQTGVEPDEYEVLLVLDRCTDSTGDRALQAASDHPDLRLTLLEGPGLGAGHARRVGMEAACERLISLGRPGALMASTDADTVVAPDWLYRQLSAARNGARAIGGRIELLDEEVPSEEIRARRDRRGATRHLELLERENSAASRRVEHWQFSGASMSLTAEAYREVGGLEPRSALEDEHLESALGRCNIPIERPLDVRVSTSPRLVGRASRGLARDLSLASWLKSNTYHDYLEKRINDQRATVSVIVPVCNELSPPPLPEIPGVELELIQVSTSGHAIPLSARFGPVLGRGDALWRGLLETSGDLVVFLPELSAESLASVPALLKPLLEREDLDLVKGYPMDGSISDLSRLIGIPLINLHHPELAGLVDPLSGFTATRRSLVETLAFPVGSGINASLLLDTARSRGAASIAQVALSPHPHPVPTSTKDAHEIMAAFLSRTGGDTEDTHSLSPLIVPDPANRDFDSIRSRIEERPPVDSLERPDSNPLQCVSHKGELPVSLQSESARS